MRPNVLAIAALLAVAALSACDKTRPSASGPNQTACTGCHGGTDNGTGAPPRDTAGRTSTQEVTVGAHTAHLKAGVACGTCHLVPSQVTDAGHMDGALATVTFKLVAVAGGVTARWDRTATGAGGTKGSCSVWCHGASPQLAGGVALPPYWTGTLAGAPCGSCHGSPPPTTSGHPAVAVAGGATAFGVCAACHPGTVAQDGTIIPASQGGLHVDGTVEISGTGACTSCHGDANRANQAIAAAPPVDVHGLSASPKVGAHLVHLQGGPLAKPFACGECHVIPGDTSHSLANAGDAKVKFGGPLGTQGATPTFTAGTCSNVYCHGGGATPLPGGFDKSPTWSSPASGACGACHFTANPPAPHPARDQQGLAITGVTQCWQCHPGTMSNNGSSGDGTINVAGGLHVNGHVEFGQVHAAGWVVASGAQPHGLAALATSGGATPLLTSSVADGCKTCHGAAYGGGLSGQAPSCTTCHADPANNPAANGGPVTGYAGPRHPSWQQECIFCHGGANPSNGHFPAIGQGNSNVPTVTVDQAAPPAGTQGETAVGQTPVGAHQAHINVGALANAFQCAQCHGPTLPGDVGHVNGLVTLGWQVAVSNGVTASPAGPTLVRVGGSSPLNCANYCHGGKWAGNAAYLGSKASVSWIGGSPEAACGTCHKAPPTSVAHTGAGVTAATNCAGCHSGYNCPTGVTSCVLDATGLSHHVNGTTDVDNLNCSSCHGDGTRTPITSATTLDALGHNLVLAAPPTDAAGGTAGVHQQHVNQATYRSAPIACTQCHFGLVPTSVGASGVHQNGTRNIAGDPSLAVNNANGNAGAAQALTFSGSTCSNTYCHGNFKNGKLVTPSWTTPGALNCNSCHGAGSGASATLPAGTHPQRTTVCATCHTGYTNTAVNPAAHMNGVVDYVTLTCTTCHGTTGRTSLVAGTDANLPAAPPVDSLGNSAVSARGVGAHQAHLNQATFRATPIGCAECHAGFVPTTMLHANGAVGMGGGPLALTAAVGNAGTPQALTWSGTTCSNTYCHGNFRNGANAVMTWAQNTTLACNTCHGLPPGGTHTTSTTCSSCHTGYPDSPTPATTFATVPAVHMNGVVNVAALSCTSCHGDAARTADSATLQAAPPRDVLGLTVSARVGAHQVHLHDSAVAKAFACGECHTVPADSTHSSANLGDAKVTFAGPLGNKGTGPGFAAGTCSNVYCHGVTLNGGTNKTPLWSGGPAQAACGTCHGFPPTVSPHTPALTTVAQCNPCHPGTANTNGTLNIVGHVNGTVEFAGGAESGGGAACSGCHPIYNAMLASASTSVSKHTLASDGAGDTAVTWAAPLNTSVPAAQRSCVNMCHGDHPHDVTGVTTHEYNLYANPTSQANRNAATRTTATRARVDFDPATGTGMCAKCHANAIATGRQVVTEAGFAVAAHNGTTTNNGTTTSTWQYLQHDGGVTLRNCTKCHASRAEGQVFSVTTTGGVSSVHFATDPKLLSGTINPGAATNSTRPAAFVCYNCHGDNVGNMKQRVNKDLWTATQKAFAHPVNMDTTHDTNAESAAAFNARFSGTNRHVSCLDCHDSHAAGRTKVNRAATATGARNRIPAGSPLSGADGINVTTWPTAPTATGCASQTGPSACWPTTNGTNYAATLATATYEWQVCFKCHSNYAYGMPTSGGTYPTAPPAYASGMASTDLAMDFAPTNRSGHPVVTGLNHYTGSTAKGLAATQLLAPWNTNMGEQTMLCTDCHNTDAAAPAVQGPHGSAVRFMLAGTNKAWPYNVAGATSGTLIRVNTSETNLGTTNGLFCRNCHPQQNSAGSNALHRISDIGGSNGQHTSQGCTFCHLRIPHGGKVTRLIVTSNAPARYKGPTVAMAQFVKQAKDSYTQNNVMTTACGTHTKNTGESW